MGIDTDYPVNEIKAPKITNDWDPPATESWPAPSLPSRGRSASPIEREKQAMFKRVNDSNKRLLPALPRPPLPKQGAIVAVPVENFVATDASGGSRRDQEWPPIRSGLK